MRKNIYEKLLQRTDNGELRREIRLFRDEVSLIALRLCDLPGK